jgi:NIPSNAP
MFTLCIRYTLDPNKVRDFEAYAKALAPAVERCGGEMAGYYLPTKLAGPINTALGFIDFPDLAGYERYREKLATNREAVEAARRAEAAGCILGEDRAFMSRVPESRR